MKKKVTQNKWREALWKIYEGTVYRLLRTIPAAIVDLHPTINKRKFDFSITLPVAIPFSTYFQAKFNLIIGGDCKLYGKRVGVKTVDSFIGMLKDAGLPFGIMVSESGFTKGASARAAKEGITLLHFPRDLSCFNREDDEISDICKGCPAESENSSPGMIYWRFDGPSTHDYGYMTGECGKCGTSYAQCFDCGEITGFLEGDFNAGIECSGGCGRVYMVQYADNGTFSIDIRSFDALYVNILTECYSKKSGISTTRIKKIIGATKWRFWTVGDPLIGLYELDLIKETSVGYKLTGEGKDLARRYLLKPRSSYHGWG